MVELNWRLKLKWINKEEENVTAQGRVGMEIFSHNFLMPTQIIKHEEEEEAKAKGSLRNQEEEDKERGVAVKNNNRSVEKEDHKTKAKTELN